MCLALFERARKREKASRSLGETSGHRSSRPLARYKTPAFLLGHTRTHTCKCWTHSYVHQFDHVLERGTPHLFSFLDTPLPTLSSVGHILAHTNGITFWHSTPHFSSFLDPPLPTYSSVGHTPSRISALDGSGAVHTVLPWEAFGGHVPPGGFIRSIQERILLFDSKQRATKGVWVVEPLRVHHLNRSNPRMSLRYCLL